MASLPLKDDLYEERLHSIFKLILLVSISFHYSNELTARKAKTLLRFYGSAEIWRFDDDAWMKKLEKLCAGKKESERGRVRVKESERERERDIEEKEESPIH